MAQVPHNFAYSPAKGQPRKYYHLEHGYYTYDFSTSARTGWRAPSAPLAQRIEPHSIVGGEENHVKSMVSIDFFTVPTIRFQVLYVFLAHERRRILQFAVTAHPTAEWTVQQLRETFPWETVCRKNFGSLAIL